MLLLYQDKKKRKKRSYLRRWKKMKKQKTKKRINILKVTGLITQILSIYIMLKTNNKLIYTICFINLLVQYFYIVGYKKEVKKNDR